MYYRMPKRLLKSSNTPLSLFGIQYFMLVPPNTEVEVITTGKINKIKYWALHISKEIHVFSYVFNKAAFL